MDLKMGAKKSNKWKGRNIIKEKRKRKRKAKSNLIGNLYILGSHDSINGTIFKLWKIIEN
jgi:hypothetical protein